LKGGDKSHASRRKAPGTDFKGRPLLRGPAGKTGVWSAAFPKARAGRDRGERYSIYVGGITKNSAGFRSRKSRWSRRFWHPPDLAGPGFQASGDSGGRSGGRAGRVPSEAGWLEPGGWNRGEPEGFEALPSTGLWGSAFDFGFESETATESPFPDVCIQEEIR
jgi:hypothetical protein